MKLDTSSYYPPSPLGDDETKVNSDLALNASSGDAPAPEDKVEEKEEAPASDSSGDVEARSNFAVRFDKLDVRKALQPDADDKGFEDTPSDGYPAVTWLCRIVSWVMVPFFMPVYGLLLAFSLSVLKYVGTGAKWSFALIVAAINIALPSVIVLLLKWLGLVQDYGLNGRKERFIPYIVTILCFLGTAWFVSSRGAPSWLTMFYVGGAVAGAVDLLVNFSWKISAHAAGAAGVIALLIRIMRDGYPQPGILTWLIIAIFMTGLVASARLWLGRHTLGQVLAGATVGFCSVFFMTMIQV